MIQNPFFIVGSERSGSNLLRAILNQLPDVVIPHPPHLMRDLGPLFERYGDLSDNARLRKLIDHAENLVDLHFAPWPFRIDKERVFDEAVEIPGRDPYAIYALIYEQYREFEEKKRWGCKSTFMIHNVQQALDHHAHPQFIHLVRDGRDVAVSARKSIFSHYHPYFVARLWSREQRLAIDWSNRLGPQQWLTVHYENLIANPESEVRRVCGFLNESYNSQMLNYFDKAPTKNLAKLNRSWENLGKPVLQSNSEKYVRELSGEERDLFEFLAGPELQHFGYLSQSPTIKAISPYDRLKYFLSENKSWAVEETKGLLKDRNGLLRWRKKIYLKFLDYTL
jgi:hypothetical protein